LDGTPIGEFSFSIDAHQRALVDLKLTPVFWGQHYAKEALTLALHELFTTSAIVTALAEPAKEHLAARQLLQHCGFHAQPSENHPDRMECTRRDFGDHEKALRSET
jgi:RimJ/RimL family protein N-acetyltransferase